MPSKEIELTARCTEAELKKAQDILIELGGKLLHQRKRFMVRVFEDEIDITSEIDLRVKWTDGEEKITFKKGRVGSHEREETEIILESGHIFETLKLFQGLGFKRGLAMSRDINCYELDDLEVSFIQAGNTYYVEIEYNGTGDGVESIKQKIRKLFDNLHLTVLSDDEYQELIEYLDEHENLLFSISDLPDVLADDQKWGPIWKEVNI